MACDADQPAFAVAPEAIDASPAAQAGGDRFFGNSRADADQRIIAERIGHLDVYLTAGQINVICRTVRIGIAGDSYRARYHEFISIVVIGPIQSAAAAAGDIIGHLAVFHLNAVFCPDTAAVACGLVARDGDILQIKRIDVADDTAAVFGVVAAGDPAGLLGACIDDMKLGCVVGDNVAVRDSVTVRETSVDRIAVEIDS